ncbi:hypothetical protein CTAYLR_008615 [Chrysophaeum taylorii]|uniref:Uncharacterized protein n=1 Tax=Chrysophaeum taylorii TaxID=2483200 RepID=A0AAD7UJ17_9STRA|nr:hypothetical protein CTAYLR_008615 [Chrysophaeum taylorii]
MTRKRTKPNDEDEPKVTKQRRAKRESAKKKEDTAENESDSPIVILVAVDNTLNNFNKQVIEAAKKSREIKQRFPIEERSGVVQENFDEQWRAEVTKIYEAAGYTAALDILTGAKDALDEMLEAGFDVRLVDTPETVADKLAWVKDKLGSHFASRLIAINDKTLLRGDVLIDDKPVAGLLEPTWHHVLYDQPYNENLKEKARLTSWHNWKKQKDLKTLLTKAAAAKSKPPPAPSSTS